MLGFCFFGTVVRFVVLGSMIWLSSVICVIFNVGVWFLAVWGYSAKCEYFSFGRHLDAFRPYITALRLRFYPTWL